MQRILMFDEPAIDDPEDHPEEFELVMGRRQMAALTFLALVVVAVCSGASYLAGKAGSAQEEPVPPVITLEQPPAPTPASIPTLEAAIVAPPQTPKAGDLPLYASPVPQAIYIQVGAVEKGVATVIAEGLRKHALDSFVAPGPSGKAFRVLIGPFANAEAYQKAQNIVDQIGLSSFARRYESQ